MIARLPEKMRNGRCDDLAASLDGLSGGQPYPACRLLERIWTSCADGPLSAQGTIEALTVPVPPEFQYYYRDLEEPLRADGRLRTLLEVVLGPQLVVSPNDAQDLLQRGLIRVRDGSYSAFSDHFHQYLTLVSRDAGTGTSSERF